jgi:hypothetical protein
MLNEPALDRRGRVQRWMHGTQRCPLCGGPVWDTITSKVFGVD